ADRDVGNPRMARQAHWVGRLLQINHDGRLVADNCGEPAPVLAQGDTRMVGCRRTAGRLGWTNPQVPTLGIKVDRPALDALFAAGNQPVAGRAEDGTPTEADRQGFDLLARGQVP